MSNLMRRISSYSVREVGIARRVVLAAMAATLWISAAAGQSPSSSSSAAGTASTATASNKDSLIVGHGTPGNLARFKNPFELGDSALFQSSLGYVGIGTTTPETTFRVINNEDSVNPFNLTPIGIYGTVT